MGYVSIYPPSTSTSEHRPLPDTITASITPLSVPQTASHLNLRDEMWKDHIIKDRDFSDLSQERRSSAQHCRSKAAQETVQEQDLTATRNSPNSDDSDDFPDIDALLSGTKQKNILASANPNKDDDDFPEIDELLSGMIQKSNSVCADLYSDDDDGFADIDEVLSGIRQESINSGSMAEKIYSGTRGNSAHPTEGSSQDPIMLSDDESSGAESETDYSFVDVDPRTKSDSCPPHFPNSEPADGDGFGLRTTQASGRLPADHPEDNNKISNSVVNDTQLRLSTKRSKSSAFSGGNAALKGNLSGLRDGQPDDAQSPQLGPAAASPHQSDLSDHLPKQLPRRGATGNVRRKRPHTAAPIRLASTAPTASAAPGSADLEEAQCRVLIAAPIQERELRDIDLKIVDDGGTDHSSDGDSADENDAAGSKTEGRPRSRKRARGRTKDVKILPNTCDVEACHPSGPVDGSSGVKAVILPDILQESEEIPVYGYLKLKMMGSNVVYCITVSQEPLPHPLEVKQKRDSNEEPQSIALDTPSQEWAISEIFRHKMVDDEMHYYVGWDRSWVPESEMGGAKELVDAYHAELRCVQGKSEDGQWSRAQKRSQLVVVGPDARGDPEPKRRRGRPRKK